MNRSLDALGREAERRLDDPVAWLELAVGLAQVALQQGDAVERAAALDVSDPKAAQSQLRELQSEFDSIGHVPRDAMRRLDDRMRAAEQRVRDAVDAEWRAASVESNPFLAELRARLVEAEEKLERARRSGDAARIKKAEDEVAARRALIPR